MVTAAVVLVLVFLSLLVVGAVHRAQEREHEQYLILMRKIEEALEELEDV